MLQTFNFTARILETAAQYPNRIAFRLPSREIRYGLFRQQILGFALRMRENGVDCGSRVRIAAIGPISQICVALACSLLGCSWIRGSAAESHAEKIGITHTVQSHDQVPVATGKTVFVDPTWLPGELVDANAFAGFESPGSICFFAQSSGTTGAAKFMAISASAQWRRLALNPFDYLGDAPPVTYSLMPALSVYGMEYVFKTLMLGGTVLMLKDSSAVISAGVNTIVGSPLQYLSLCEGLTPPSPKITCAVIGGARCNDRLFDLLLERFEIVQYQFGCAELGRISFNRFGVGATDRHAVGKPIPSAAVQIVDSSDRPLPPMTTGMLRMRSNAPMSAYVGEEPVDAWHDGWFYSGDTGLLSQDGALTIVGRANDVFNIGGAKLDANAIDGVIAATEGVKEGVSFVQSGFSPVDELTILIVPCDDSDAKIVSERARANLLAKFGKRGTVQRVYVAAEIPKNENGKVARHSLVKFVQERVPF